MVNGEPVASVNSFKTELRRTASHLGADAADSPVRYKIDTFVIDSAPESAADARRAHERRQLVDELTNLLAEYQEMKDSSAILHFVYFGSKAERLAEIDAEIGRVLGRLSSLDGEEVRIHDRRDSYYETAKEDHDIWASVNEEEKKVRVALLMTGLSPESSTWSAQANPLMYTHHLLDAYLGARGGIVHGLANLGAYVDQTGEQLLEGDFEGANKGRIAATASTGAAALNQANGAYDFVRAPSKAVEDRFFGADRPQMPWDRVRQASEELRVQIQNGADLIDPVGGQAGDGILIIIEFVVPAAHAKLLRGKFPIGASGSIIGAAGSSSLVRQAIGGTITRGSRAKLLAEVEKLIGRKVEVKYGAGFNGFSPKSKKIYLEGLDDDLVPRGTFFEEVQHLIDDKNGLNPSSIPKNGTLDDAIFHGPVFERMINNPLFDISDMEGLSLMAIIAQVIKNLGG